MTMTGGNAITVRDLTRRFGSFRPNVTTSAGFPDPSAMVRASSRFNTRTVFSPKMRPFAAA